MTDASMPDPRRRRAWDDLPWGDVVVSVVIPVYNERDTVEALLRRVDEVGLTTEVIVVDDGSTDGTRDILPDLGAASISVPEKVESLAVTADGTVYLATDNDGVDGSYGETVFIRLGSVEEAFGQA